MTRREYEREGCGERIGGQGPDGTHVACPCHRSRFALDGTREEGPAPRGLDELEAEVRDGEVWVRFQNFRPGIEEKIPIWWGGGMMGAGQHMNELPEQMTPGASGGMMGGGWGMWWGPAVGSATLVYPWTFSGGIS